MQRITSRQNPIVSRYRDVARGDVEDVLLLDGAHLVSEALAAGITLRQVAVSSEALDRTDIGAIIEHLSARGIELVAASASVMNAMSPVRSPSAMVAMAERPLHDAARLYAASVPLVIIASDVQDPGNIGAIVRAAEAGGASGVIASGNSADPFGWKALRGSMGSSLRLPIIRCRDTGQAVDQARQHGCRIVATVPKGGQPLFDLDLYGAVAVIVGGEGAGLTQGLIDAADVRVTIPMQAPVESLNAAVTAALIVYEARRQRTA